MAQFNGIAAGTNHKLGGRFDVGDLLLINSNGEKGELLEILNKYFGPEEGILIQKGIRDFKMKKARISKSLVSALYEKYQVNDPHELWLKKLVDGHCSVLFKLVRDNQGNRF